MKPTKKQMNLLTEIAKDRDPEHLVDGFEVYKTGFSWTELPTWAANLGISVKSARGVFATLVKSGWIELDEENCHKLNHFSGQYEWNMSAFTEKGVEVYECNGGEWFPPVSSNQDVQ